MQNKKDDLLIDPLFLIVDLFCGFGALLPVLLMPNSTDPQ